jgi:nitronate monooxygenase
MTNARTRLSRFCKNYGLRVPILLAPMAGASDPLLSIAVAQAGGLGACGALLMEPEEILAWANEVRSKTSGVFQINLWIPDPEPARNPEHEARVRSFLANWGPVISPEAGEARPPSFEKQFEAILTAAPAIASSVMGLYPAKFVQRLKVADIKWFANISTVREARAAEAAGADVIVAQGSEAGGHRGCFNAADAERQQIGLFALLPAVVDAVRVPVIATGGIIDARGIAAAFTLGASAVQIGTGFLRCPEANIHPTWAEALSRTDPEDTVISRVFSGRAGRSIVTEYTRAAMAEDAPAPAPYPVQRGLTAAMRSAAQKSGDLDRMQAWAGQSARLAQAKPAGILVDQLWTATCKILGIDVMLR